MTEYQLIIEPKAQEDIHGLVDYIKDTFEEPDIALKYYALIKREINSLRQLPKRFKPVLLDHYPNDGLRTMKIKNYLAFYTVDDKEHAVRVIRVIYSRRDWKSLL